MRGSSSALLFAATPGTVLRGLAAAGLFAAAVPLCPDLEDVGLLTLALLPLLAAGSAATVLLGSAWLFDAEDFDAAAARAEAVASWSLGLLTALHLTLWLAAAPGRGLEAFLALLAAGAVWAPWLWELLDEKLSRRRPAADLKAWVPLEEEPAPARREPLPAGVEAMLVASGSFRVDRARMLDKLSRYQLEDPSSFLSPWLRLAVASGASRIRLDVDGPVLALRFDGRPLDAVLLASPWNALTRDEDDAENERHAHLAYGLLALLRLSPRAVRGWSGPAAARARLTLDAPGTAPQEDADPGGADTVLLVRFDGWSAALQAREARAKAQLAWGLSDAQLVIDGEPVPPPYADVPAAVRLERDGFRLIAFRPPAGEGGGARRLYHLGALVREERDGHYGIQHDLIVAASHPDFRLNASQNRVVRSPLLARLEKLREEAERRAWTAGETAPSRRLAYTKSALLSALGAAGASFAAFSWAAASRPDLAWFLGALFALVAAVAVGQCVRWAALRLKGKRNPFRTACSLVALLLAAPGAGAEESASRGREELKFIGWNEGCAAAIQHYRYPLVEAGKPSEPSWGHVGTVTLAAEAARPAYQWALDVGGNFIWDGTQAEAVTGQLMKMGYSRPGYVERVRRDRIAKRPGLAETIRSTASFEVGYATDWPPPGYAVSRVHYSPLGTCALIVFERPGPPPDVYRYQLVRLPHHARRARARAHLNNALLLHSTESDLHGAVEEAEIAAEMDPRLGEARFHHAALLAMHGRFDESLRELREAVGIDPRYARMAKESQEFEDIRRDARFRDAVGVPAP